MFGIDLRQSLCLCLSMGSQELVAACRTWCWDFEIWLFGMSHNGGRCEPHFFSKKAKRSILQLWWKSCHGYGGHAEKILAFNIGCKDHDHDQNHSMPMTPPPIEFSVNRQNPGHDKNHSLPIIPYYGHDENNSLAVILLNCLAPKITTMKSRRKCLRLWHRCYSLYPATVACPIHNTN